MAGFFSAPNEAGVSDWTISRIGTRRSRREPSTYTLREFGIGLTAASSTRAVSARNFGLAFMALLVQKPKGSEGMDHSTLPCGGIIRIRFEGFTLTRPSRIFSVRTPTLLKQSYSKPKGLASAVNRADVQRT